MPLSFQHKPSLVAYLTCGDPDLATTRDIALAAIEAGADVIELGVPFSDPVADGPVIQRASERALRHGTSLLQVLELAKEIRQRSQAGLIIFTYLNPVLRMGMARFSAAAQDACVDGALITDLPVEESHEYLYEMQKRSAGDRVPGRAHQHRRATEADCPGVDRICVRGFAHRGDRGPAADARRCAAAGRPPAQVY